MNRLKWAQDHKAIDWNQVIISNETTILLNCVKGLPRTKKIVRAIKHPIKVNVSGCFSSKGFGRIVCSKHNLNAEFMCDIYKCGLLPTPWKQYGHQSTSWKMQKDNDPKHIQKLAVNWKRNNGIDEIDWPSMSADPAPMENIRQPFKINFRRKKIESYQSLVSVLKREWEQSLPSELTIKLVHSMNNQISEVIESHGDLILPY